MKVLSIPHLDDISGESGINTVIRNYFRYLPELGVELVAPGAESFDILHVHAGMTDAYPRDAAIVASLHGLYWTADYDAPLWEYQANAKVISSIRAAAAVTVPSAWVGEALRRDMHLSPVVVPHGVDLAEWQHSAGHGGYVLAYAKNRAWADVSVPTLSTDLARIFPDQQFMATFAQNPAPANLRTTGVLPHAQMKRLVQRAAVFVSPVKETFGIGALEALAAGVPVLTVNRGQVPELVGHGVAGYCYQEGNLEDMAEGLAYCLKHRATLSRNAVVQAARWDWPSAARTMAAVYAQALSQAGQGRVAVVIPVYNKNVIQVRRAIESVVVQTRRVDEIIVVDDGSENGDEIRDLAQGYGAIYLRQDNRGVAHARNAGIAHSTADYVVCLDADDAIAPTFVERCARALDSDRSLAIAYTKLAYQTQDGQSGTSQWPAAYDFDQFLKRKNQVPTCCLFRRTLWERLGGYRQRYAPTGAGAEDAEFWLRAGAYGYRAALVAEDPLFLYSMGGGHTSQQGYQEVDWLAWHKPWLLGRHPFASLARPQNGLSHPVRQYDEPAVSVVIPVGTGHEEAVWNALDSLEAQSFLRWEAVVVWDSERLLPRQLYDAFPFVRWVLSERRGAGAARNAGAEQARAPLLLFLDADDWLYPDFLEKVVGAWSREQEAVYTDYVGVALVEDPAQLAGNLQRNLLDYDPDSGRAVIRYQAADFDCQRAIAQPEGPRPYHWCNITTLVPKSWHEEIGGFDEQMPSWEDVDYWWRMARAGKCFQRLPEPLMVYQFHTGERREQGLRQHPQLIEYLQGKRQEDNSAMCGCKGNKPSPVAERLNTLAGFSTTTNSLRSEDMSNDSDWIMARYNSSNYGQHPVTGTGTGTRYGYRSGGEEFLVHVDDISAQPHLFHPVRQEREVVVAPAKPPRPPEPELLDDPKVDAINPRPTTPEPEADEVLAAIREQEEAQASRTPLDLSLLNLRKEAIQNLVAAGVVTKERALELGVAGLTEIKWVGQATAEDIIKFAESL